MNDQERLHAIQSELAARQGLDSARYERVLAELSRTTPQHGYDSENRLKLAMFDARSYDIESFAEQNRGEFAICPIPAALGVDTVQAAAGHRAICIFVNDHCTHEVVETLARLGVELIALRCAGFNNVDLQACRRHGIDVVRVPEYSPYAVAEHTIALMLMLNRKLHQAYLRNRVGSFVLDGLTGFDMRGKTVGIIGTGKIGRCVIDILRGFGCRVLAYDQHPNPSFQGQSDVQYVAIEQLFSQSDIITLHVPLFPETHHLIDAEAIARMKPGAMLINTSRGGLVDTRALIDGLKSRQIGSAGLDVYEEESGVFFHDLSDDVLTDDVLARLMTFNNVVVTSHQAFLTQEALSNIAAATLASLREFVAGKRGLQLSHVISPEPEC